MRRIIKDIKFNGNTQYRVDTNKILFIIIYKIDKEKNVSIYERK